jgi:hypothetical protein
MPETPDQMAEITTNLIDQQDDVEIADDQTPVTEAVEEDQ